MNKHLITAFACCVFLFGCKDDDNGTSQFDPSQPIVFTDFTPKEGSVRTRLYITGSNFGEDESRIHVNVGGKEAKVIGSNGRKIYCMVPARATKGNVTVKIDGTDGKTVVDYTFEEQFVYQQKLSVGTILRNVDEHGDCGWEDGNFDDGSAKIRSASWLIFEPKAAPGDPKKLYTCSWNDGLRVFDLTNRTLTTCFAKGAINSMQSFCFSADGDTIFAVNDNQTDESTEKANIYYALRSEGFRKIQPYNYGPRCYGCVSMPDGSMFYSTWKGCSVYKMKKTGSLPNVDTDRELCFSVGQIAGKETGDIKMVLHPSKEYMYIFCQQIGAIMRSNYDPARKMFETPTIVVGYSGEKGCKEGIGTSARMDQPFAGVFVYNPEYENRADGEKYDFYCTDYGNYCVYKVTPDYVLTIAAGRSNYNADQSYKGYIDGDPLTEARFGELEGIAFDPEEEKFYIGDYTNRALRSLGWE